MRDYLIADLDLFSPPDNMTLKVYQKTLKDKWNEVVTEEDSVYLIGKITDEDKFLDTQKFFKELKGKKKIISYYEGKDKSFWNRSIWERIVDKVYPYGAISKVEISGETEKIVILSNPTDYFDFIKSDKYRFAAAPESLIDFNGERFKHNILNISHKEFCYYPIDMLSLGYIIEQLQRKED